MRAVLSVICRVFCAASRSNSAAFQAPGFEGGQIFRPYRFLIAPQPVKRFPGKKSRVVTVAEDKAQGVIADRLKPLDRHVPLSGHDLLLPRSMALHLGAWAFDAQIFRRQRKPCAVLEGDFEQALGLLEADIA